MFLATGVSGLARRLNLGSLSADLPEEFEGVFDPEAYRSSGQYIRDSSRLEGLREWCETVATAVFVVAGGLGWLDGWTRSLGLGGLSTGLVFVGVLALAQVVLNLPFSVYGTFVVEARHGFNRTTPAVFVLDRLKGLALGAVLGGGLLAAVLEAYRLLGGWAWLAAWGAAGAFTAVMLVVAPVWILPLFNTFKPLEDGALRAAIETYAAGQGFALGGIFVMDGSRRSSKANAFFTGFGRLKRISLYDTLLDRLDQDQVVAVLAHEVGHYRLRHQLRGFALALAKMGVLFWLLQVFLGWADLQQAFGVQTPSAHAGLVIFGLAFQPLALAMGVAANACSRRFEAAADAFAASGPGGAEALAEALKALSRANLSNLTPHRLWVWLNAGHPPVLERIRALRALKESGERSSPRAPHGA